MVMPLVTSDIDGRIRRILALLDEHGEMTTIMLAKHLGINSSQLAPSAIRPWARAMYRIQNDGRVARKKGNCKEWIYYLQS